ncbi:MULTISPECIES: SDR family NAD(P)-dependent oxidoreductase [Sphingobacterium]|uniref:SDR family NAD(P)-dependent oxidoreductase n=1 Tax=Sphingobacterium populi TaxID=1812824 RepID=A0ABW5U7C4_9SPHI|nr:SDR family NAD(P)-dependent oxidoreductase [Sphingobacterium sp. CFCC 11742]
MKEERDKVWFITGTSRGFGRVWTEAALRRGDKVVATARTADTLGDLKDKYGDSVLTLDVDVTNPEQVRKAVQVAVDYFGRLDVVFNNAGYSLIGTIEECTPDEIRAMYETNIIGAVNVLQSTIPILRKQGYGHILGTSSAVGHYSLPVIGYYSSSKWAFEAIYESLQKEVEDFGIHVTIIEPGAYATEFGSMNSLRIASQKIVAYDRLKDNISVNMKKISRGNPNATINAILSVVDADHPPLRLLLGKGNLAYIENVYQRRLETWKGWEHISESAQ